MIEAETINGGPANVTPLNGSIWIRVVEIGESRPTEAVIDQAPSSAEIDSNINAVEIE